MDNIVKNFYDYLQINLDRVSSELEDYKRRYESLQVYYFLKDYIIFSLFITLLFYF
jgi:hypothetical protein